RALLAIVDPAGREPDPAALGLVDGRTAEAARAGTRGTASVLDGHRLLRSVRETQPDRVARALDRRTLSPDAHRQPAPSARPSTFASASRPSRWRRASGPAAMATRSGTRPQTGTFSDRHHAIVSSRSFVPSRAEQTTRPRGVRAGVIWSVTSTRANSTPPAR